MKISYNWLRKYTDVDLGVDELAEILTNCGLEVEGVEPFETIKGSLEGVVTGQVLTCERHPNADKLSITTVDIGGSQPLPIVCGAPNVAAGQKVLVATVGTTIYKGDDSFVINEAKIRGEISRGMICAEDELGLGTSHEGIMVLPEDTAVGLPAHQLFKVYKDHVFEIGLTPNRSDAFSHTGVARDLLAVLKTHQPEKYGHLHLQWPDTDEFKSEVQGHPIPVMIENPQDCPRYCGLTLTGIQMGSSPEWMQNLLKAGGMRPINVIVDITNFVMLETGQPLHAFDADKIEGQRVVVKTLGEGTRFITLDGAERTLTASNLMICSGERGMCMAGVYGGLDSGVTDTTTRVFLESAYFNPVSIRKTARNHGLSTDSSQRFERGANPEMTVYAMKRAALLMKEYAGAVISSEIQDVYPGKKAPRQISVSYKNIDTLIGKSIPRETIRNILISLEMIVESETADGMVLSVPLFKNDVEREADVVEEILRIYGYNQIELSNEIRYMMGTVRPNKKEKARDLISEHLTALGFSEIMCNSLTRSEYTIITPSLPQESYVRMMNPLSREAEVMRRSLLFGGLETILHNQNRKISDLKLYEYGTVYQFIPQGNKAVPLSRYREDAHLGIWVTGKRSPEHWSEKKGVADIYYLKAVLINILRKAGVREDHFSTVQGHSGLFAEGMQYVEKISGKVLLEFGEVLPGILKHFDLRQAVYFAMVDWNILWSIVAENRITYTELPKFPWVRRDLALLLDRNISFEQLRALALQVDQKILRKVSLFDVYEGEGVASGKKSYALSFILQDDHKTLTDEEIDALMSRLMKQFQKQMGAEIR